MGNPEDDEILPAKRKLISLVEAAHEGRVCLPQFQRDFVWHRDEVADLLRSILRRYYIGSLLLLRCDPQSPPFQPMALRGAKPEHTKLRPELLVLDGQQRLTSLIYALTAPDLPLKGSKLRRWFFVDLKQWSEDPDSDDIVLVRSKRDLDGLDQTETQYERRVLPCTSLLRFSDFSKWKDGLEDWLRDNDADALKEYREKSRDSWQLLINNFQSFQVPLVELPRVEESDSAALGRVCTIFEKLNSTGVALSVYDLLTARLYRYGIRLHELWDEACKNNKRLAEWSQRKADNHKFGVLILRVLALRRGLDPKPRILINLKPDGFEEDWRRAAEAMETAISITELVAEDGFGVFAKKWLPGFGLLPVLAALRAEVEDKKLSDQPREELRRWYWCNVFLGRYSSAVESKSRRDYAEFMSYWTDGGAMPSVFAEAKQRIGAPGYSVRTAASHASAIYSGVFCLLARRQARDWRRGEDLQLQKLQDHHIYPKKYLSSHDVTKRARVNTVLNRTLISNETNNKIKAKPPAEYVASKEIFPKGASDKLLLPHFIDQDALGAMKQAEKGSSSAEAEASYEEFLEAREALILDAIREVCGIAPPADSGVVPSPEGEDDDDEGLGPEVDGDDEIEDDED